MSQLATIFEKIKEDFFTNHVDQGNRENFELIFSPFSTGFTNDDFLFLDSATASSSADSARKYQDELYEFFQIANTIPLEANFWTISGDKNDYLSSKYKHVIEGLKFIDIETLTIDMLYEHPVFNQALNAINSEQQKTYTTFYNLKSKLNNTINTLKSSINETNEAIVELEIKMNQENVNKLNEKWVSNGFKNDIETKIINIIKDEFNRFMLLFNESKAKLLTLKREHLTSGSDYYITSCSPNNLYKSDALDWKKMTINPSELESLFSKVDIKSYESVFGNSQLSQLDLESVQFELIFVNVERAWYEEQIIKSPFWDINLLNKDQISIPKITSKLIFIRRVDLKVKKNANNNRLLNEKASAKNLGPFMINMSNYKIGQSLKLKSINTSLHIDRKVVMNVSSKINKKTEDRAVKTIVNQKQHQFITLAPHLKKQFITKETTKIAAFTKPMSLQFVIPPLISAINTVNCKFTFIDARSLEVIKFTPEKIKIHYNKKPLNVSINQEGGTLKTVLTGDTFYRLFIEEDAILKPVVFDFKTSKVNSSKNNFIIKVTKKEIIEEIDNSFQLIGVIAKTLEDFPNPIKKATYF